MAYGTSSSGLLTFLDTNVVQNLHTFGEFIYRGNFSPQDEEKLSILAYGKIYLRYAT